jgi:hypothetical protein
LSEVTTHLQRDESMEGAPKLRCDVLWIHVAADATTAYQPDAGLDQMHIDRLEFSRPSARGGAGILYRTIAVARAGPRCPGSLELERRLVGLTPIAGRASADPILSKAGIGGYP